MTEELTEDQLDAAFNDAAAEADQELAAPSSFGDDDDMGGDPSPHEQPEDELDESRSERVQQPNLSAPPRPQAQQADAPAWINAIADADTREQALSDWTRLRHSEASQRGRAAALNRKWSEAQDLIRQREQEQAAGDDTAATEDKLAQIKEDFPVLGDALQELMAERDRKYEEKLSRLSAPLDAIEKQKHQQEVYEQGALVAEQHPDWAEIAGRGDFSAWVQESPHRTAMFNADDALSTIELLSLYKLQHGLINQSNSQQQHRQRRRSQLSDLASLPSGGSSRLPMADDDDLDALFDAAAKAADAELKRYR